MAACAAGQTTATGVHLADVRFSGDTRSESLDLNKCAADLKSTTYEGPDWLAGLAERVRIKCLQDKGYYKATVTPAAERPPDKNATHQFIVTFEIHAGAQYRVKDIVIRNSRVFSARELRSMFAINPGDVFRPANIGQTIAQIRKAYLARGFMNFVAVPNTEIDDSNQLISIVIDCDEGVQSR
jgi:outer membrane protein assembly factor BamA